MPGSANFGSILHFQYLHIWVSIWGTVFGALQIPRLRSTLLSDLPGCGIWHTVYTETCVLRMSGFSIFSYEIFAKPLNAVEQKNVAFWNTAKYVNMLFSYTRIWCSMLICTHYEHVLAHPTPSYGILHAQDTGIWAYTEYGHSMCISYILYGNTYRIAHLMTPVW